MIMYTFFFFFEGPVIFLRVLDSLHQSLFEISGEKLLKNWENNINRNLHKEQEVFVQVI